MKANKKDLSLIIPCYNEGDNLPLLLKKLLKIKSEFHEIILVNNGSTDNTDLIIKELIKDNNSCIKILNIKKNIGYGHGIMSGVKIASGNTIAWTHADLQTDPKDVLNAYDLYIKNKNYHNCFLKGKRQGRNFFDNLFTLFMSIISSLAMNVKLSDINAQPKMFNRRFIKLIENSPDDFSLDLYVLVKAINKKYTILEFPVNFGKRNFGSSKGGGSLVGKVKLTLRTLSYIKKLRGQFRN